MKKLFLPLFALLISVGVSAQTTSVERIAELIKMVVPATTGLSQLDALAAASEKIANESVAISPLLESATGKVAEGDLSAELVKEIMELKERISNQSDNIGEIPAKTAAAAEEIKGVKNPLKLKSAKNSLDYSKESISLATEETVYQAAAIADLLTQIASASGE